MKNLSSPEALPFLPLVIIGAGRSGTNALRDSLVKLDGFATWPCDEINPVWRHGNIGHPDDAIPASAATAVVRHFIRKSFVRIWRRTGCPRIVVEKTCANCLRVPFVDAVLPEARFIHIVRDGFDVMASARKRWSGELDVAGLAYYLAKARCAPIADLPIYALRAVRNHLAIRLGRRAHFDVWGPIFQGMADLRDVPLDQRIALQWSACVTSANAALQAMAPDRVFDLRYEDFVAEPVAQLERIMHWLGRAPSRSDLVAAAGTIQPTSVGKGRHAASAIDRDTLAVLEEPMKLLGYRI